MATYVDQKAEDSAASSGDLGFQVLGQRNDSNTSRTDTDGDYGTVAVDAAGNVRQVGNIAHDGADAGNPVKIGGKARTTNPSDVADGDRADLFMDVKGKPVVLTNTPRDLVVEPSPTTITSTTTATSINSADASNKLDMLSIVLVNGSSTRTRVELYDNDGSTLRWVFFVPGNDMRGMVFQTPLKMPSSNSVWKVKTVTSVASLYVSCQLMKVG